ncbi:uncharacterized protein LOC124497259 [Dermatophagoides farinae]|uniref:uncharacterized protein LOC124497259 n=1 Tax=Dermatophagoides farinae TaxID=6954 RepID=UPI003F624B3C
MMMIMFVKMVIITVLIPLLLFPYDYIVIVDALPVKNRREIALPNPYDTWGDYCRMKNPFHPKCRGIAVQKLIDISIEQMDPEHREQYREFLIGYVIDKYPNVVGKLLKNNDIIRRMVMNESKYIEQQNQPMITTTTNDPVTIDISNDFYIRNSNNQDRSLIFD